MSEIHITNNYYAPIGQKIDSVETMHVHYDKDATMSIQHVETMDGMPSVESATAHVLPEELSTPHAHKMWESLQQDDIVDADFQLCDPSLSRQAIVAEEMSRKLFIAENVRWTLFEQLWGVKNLRSKAKDRNTEFRSKVKESIRRGTQKIKI